MDMPEKLKIINKISEGCFGEVILCENTYLANRKEAVKYIKTKTDEENGKMVEIDQNLFESSVLEYLKQSPYIVEVYDAEVLPDGFRINMEFLENGSVQDLLNKKTFLDFKQILKISECVLNALEYAHTKGILHLDVKPGNILVKNENIYKLSDFGLSTIRDENGESCFKQIYTMHTPPEKLSNDKEKAGVQSDVYMFGVTIYRLLNGDGHFLSQLSGIDSQESLNNVIISGKFPNRNGYLPHVHKKFIKIINKCISVDLEERYKSVREIRNELGKIRIIYKWIPKNITVNLYHWECYIDNKMYLELFGEKKSNNLWSLTLFKYGKIKRIRISKNCHNNLTEKEFFKKINIIFNTYF